MQTTISDHIEVLKAAEYIKQSSLISSENKKAMLKELTSFVPLERFCLSTRMSRAIVVEIIEGLINEAEKTTKKSTPKAKKAATKGS